MYELGGFMISLTPTPNGVAGGTIWSLLFADSEQPKWGRQRNVAY